MKFFAYRHTSGAIKVKRYGDDFGRDAYNAAEDSEFIDAVLKPYEAENRKQAEQIAKGKLSLKPVTAIS